MGSPVKLNSNMEGKALRHSIAIDGGNIHVVWMDFRNCKWDIYYSRVTRNPLGTWVAQEALIVSGANGFGEAGSGAQRPQIAANGNTIHVTWMDGRDGNALCDIEGSMPSNLRRLPQCTEIYYAKSIDNGASFLVTPTVPLSSITRLTTSTTNPITYSGRPDIVTDGSNRVYVLYDKRTPSIENNANQLFLRKSVNNGVSFEQALETQSPEVRLTNDDASNDPVSTHSSGIVVGSTLYTIWIKDTNGGGDYKVFSRDGDLAASTTNQQNQQLVSAGGNAGAPILGASNSYIHAIWGDGAGVKYSRRLVRTIPFDFDGDGRADISVFRPSNVIWYLLNSQTGFTSQEFGIPNQENKLAPADYDGDGKTDIAVFSPDLDPNTPDGVWYLLRSSLGYAQYQWGRDDDIPQPADFDGDGRAELAVYRPSNSRWYVLNLVNLQVTDIPLGNPGDKPVVGDYDGDRKADYAVYRPLGSVWFLLRSNLGFLSFQHGILEDKPVVGDYDKDGRSDIATYRPSNGTWYLSRSSLGFTSIQFGIPEDMPTPMDYDGDGKTNLAVYRPLSGTWYILNQTQPGYTTTQFGINGDKPVPNAFVP